MSEFRSILPPDTTTRTPLLAVMGIMTYLAALSLIGAVILQRATTAWTSDLAGAATVQLKPVAGVSADLQRNEALTILKATKGVVGARVLPSSEIENLIAPWLGKSTELKDLSVPQLIAVQLASRTPIDLTALQDTLSKRVPGASLDDHTGWNTRLMRVAHQVRALGVAILGLITVATVGIVIFATRADLRANNETVEVLHLVGARDGFIAQVFERYFLWTGLRAGLIGIGLAAITLAAIFLSVPDGEFFLPHFELTWRDPMLLMLVPIAAALVAMLTARLTVLNVLRALI